MSIRDILQRRKINSNINPIARMGVPVRSNYSTAADYIQTPDRTLGLLGGTGNLVTGLTSALKGGLGFYGAKQDARNQQAYNEYLAEQAEQARQDKLAQQDAENQYKQDALAQQAELAQKQIDAQAALQANQFNQQKEMEGIKNEYAKGIMEAQAQAAFEAEQRKREAEQEAMVLKQLDPASQQYYYQLKKEGKQPIVIDNKVGTIGKIMGTPKYAVSDGVQPVAEVPTIQPSLGFGGFLDMAKRVRALKQKPTQQAQTINGYTIVQE